MAVTFSKTLRTQDGETIEVTTHEQDLITEDDARTVVLLRSSLSGLMGFTTADARIVARAMLETADVIDAASVKEVSRA